jgi:hypothetical protein
MVPTAATVVVASTTIAFALIGAPMTPPGDERMRSTKVTLCHRHQRRDSRIFANYWASV